MNASYQQLIDEHEEISRCASVMLDELGATGEQSRDSVCRQFTKLCVLIDAHAAKEALVLAELIDKRPGDRIVLKAAESCDVVQGTSRSLFSRWDHNSIHASWYEFRLDARRALQNFRQKLESEENAFYSPALQQGVIPLR